MINTPTGNISQGAVLPVTWETDGPTPQPGTLSVVNRDTQDTKTISDEVDLDAKKLDWTVDVEPGEYHFVLNDGSGEKFSGPFTVVQGTFFLSFCFFLLLYKIYLRIKISF